MVESGRERERERERESNNSLFRRNNGRGSQNRMRRIGIRDSGVSSRLEKGQNECCSLLRVNSECSSVMRLDERTRESRVVDCSECEFQDLHVAGMDHPVQSRDC